MNGLTEEGLIWEVQYMGKYMFRYLQSTRVLTDRGKNQGYFQIVTLGDSREYNHFMPNSIL